MPVGPPGTASSAVGSAGTVGPSWLRCAWLQTPLPAPDQALEEDPGLGIRRAALSPGDWRTAETISVLGGCLVALERFEEAEALLLESYPVLRERRPRRDWRAIQTLERLVRLYTAWDRPDEADRYRAILEEAGR